jgi:hypothetical protein
MNRLSRLGIAVALVAGALWSGGVAEAGYFVSPVTVCVDASSGLVRLVASSSECVGSAQTWSASQPAPLLCWNASSLDPQVGTRKVSVAPSSGCTTPLRSVPVDNVSLLCAGGEFGVLRWPVTGSCRSGATPIRVRSAATPTTVATTTSTIAVVVPSVSLSTTWIQSITFPKAVTVTANVAGTIYFAEGAFVVKTVSDITSAPSYRWAKGTVTSANTPTSIAIDVDAVTNGYYRVFIANSQGVLSAPATNIVTISVPRTPTAAEIAAGTTTTTTTTVPPVCDGTAALCRVGVDTGPGGGPIFYFSETAFTSTGSTCNTNCHYLEAAPSDQSTAILWATTAPKCWRIANGSNNNDCQTFSVYSPHDTPNQANSRTAAPAIGKGKLNTDQIHSRFTLNGGVSTSSYGAGVARAYTNNSKTDWFLPSQLELNQMCRYAWNLTVDNTATTCTGMSGTIRTGFSTGLYWGSSEFDDMTVRAQNFNDGSQFNGAKSLTMRVRPVRAG